MRKTIAVTIVFACLCSVFIMLFQIRQQVFPASYEKVVRTYAERFKLDPLWVAAMISVESSFNQDAVSPSGAVGLMQIMPATGREIAGKIGLKDYSRTELKNPSVNIMIGCWYFRKLLERFGSREKALIAYNAGPGNLEKWMQGSVSARDVLKKAYPETKNHVKKVKRIYAVLRAVTFIKGL